MFVYSACLSLLVWSTQEGDPASTTHSLYSPSIFVVYMGKKELNFKSNIPASLDVKDEWDECLSNSSTCNCMHINLYLLWYAQVDTKKMTNFLWNTQQKHKLLCSEIYKDMNVLLFIIVSQLCIYCHRLWHCKEKEVFFFERMMWRVALFLGVIYLFVWCVCLKSACLHDVATKTSVGCITYPG